MSKLILLCVLLLSLMACADSPQNSQKQKDMTQGSSPQNGTTATEDQNYGAGSAVGSSSSSSSTTGATSQDKTDHTDNMTKPAPTTPTPQASGTDKGSARQRTTPKK